MLTLYYATNTCALASHIALEEAGAAFETRWIDFAAAEQTKPDYLMINPKGRVPSLVTERGVLTETPAILATPTLSPTHTSSRSRGGWRATASTPTPSPGCSSTGTGWPNAPRSNAQRGAGLVRICRRRQKNGGFSHGLH
jgi:hypothetical protein